MVILELKINGAEKPELIDRIDTLSIVERTRNMLDTLEFNLSNTDEKFTVPSNGAEIEVIINNILLGNFIVNKISYSSNHINFFCIASILIAENNDNKFRCFENKSLSDILKTLCTEMSLSVVVDSSIASVNIPYLSQNGQTNLQIIENLATLFYTTVRLSDNELIFIPFDLLTKEATVYDNDILEIELEDNQTGYKGVVAHEHNLGNGKLTEVIEGEAPYYYLSSPYTNELLKTHTKSKLKELLNQDELHIKTVGKLDIQSGERLIFQENTVYDDFNTQDYIIIAVTHIYSAGKLLTRIKLQPI